jgi:U3 small nucleolar RNA-associated protein 21
VLTQSGIGGNASLFYRMVRVPSSNGYEEVVTYLASLGPSATELEFQMVSGEIEEDLSCAMTFFLAILETSTDFDLVEAWMNLFLKLHADVIASSPSLHALSIELEQRQHQSWTRLEGLFQNTLCLINLLSGVGLSG